MTLWHGISRLRIKKIKATNNNVSPGLVQYWCMTYFSKLILSLSLELTVADMCILFQRWLISDRGCITFGSGNINTGDGNEFDLDRIIRLGHTTSLRSKTIWKLDVYILDRLVNMPVRCNGREKTYVHVTINTMFMFLYGENVVVAHDNGRLWQKR